MDELTRQALAAFGIAPQFYVVLGALGVINAALKSSVSKWSRIHSLLVAGVFSGAFGGALWFQQTLPPVEGLTNLVTLFAAAVLVEFGLELLPGFKNNANTKSPPPSQRGFMRTSALATTLAVLILVAALVTIGHAQTPGYDGPPGVFSLKLAGNGVWFEGPKTAFPADAEAGLQGAASLSPHLAAVGSALYGLTHAYVRYTVGARVTATDVADPNFSIGFGVQYHGYSKAEMRPNEWAPDASVGWKPVPKDHPQLTLVAQGWYGLKSERAGGLLGLRWTLFKQHGKEVTP